MKDLNKVLLGLLAVAGLMLFSTNVPAETLTKTQDLSGHWVGYLCVGIFAVAYIFVVLDEVLELRKSKPMMLAALIWVAIALVYKDRGFVYRRNGDSARCPGLRRIVLGHRDIGVFYFLFV